MSYMMQLAKATCSAKNVEILRGGQRGVKERQ